MTGSQDIMTGRRGGGGEGRKGGREEERKGGGEEGRRGGREEERRGGGYNSCYLNNDLELLAPSMRPRTY